MRFFYGGEGGGGPPLPLVLDFQVLVCPPHLFLDISGAKIPRFSLDRFYALCPEKILGHLLVL